MKQFCHPWGQKSMLHETGNTELGRVSRITFTHSQRCYWWDHTHNWSYRRSSHPDFRKVSSTLNANWGTLMRLQTSRSHLTWQLMVRLPLTAIRVEKSFFRLIVSKFWRSLLFSIESSECFLLLYHVLARTACCTLWTSIFVSKSFHTITCIPQSTSQNWCLAKFFPICIHVLPYLNWLKCKKHHRHCMITLSSIVYVCLLHAGRARSLQQ